jgi:hypothetical protein
MKRIVWLLFVVVMIFPAVTKAQGTPPDPISVCFAPCTSNDWNNYISVGDFQGERVGSLGIGYFAWHVDVNAWSIEHIKLTLTTRRPDVEGKTEVIVIEGKFDQFKDGVAHGKARYVSGHAGGKPRDVTLTWTPKMRTGLFIN